MNEEEAFAELEKINAQVDIWIDDEEFDKVENLLRLNSDCIYTNNNIINFLGCYKKVWALDCLHSSNGIDAWNDLIKGWTESVKNSPVAIWAPNGCLSKHLNILSDILQKRSWSALLFAKLLRARIQKQGSDCYFGRLDDLVTFLENNLPNITDTSCPNQSLNNRLATLYLLELSATSESVEQLGYAQRAERIMKKYYKDGSDLRRVYEWWAHYIIGLSYQHSGQYIKAISEFDLIIYEYEKRKHSIQKTMLNLARDLLYIPALLARAEALLKLQIPYHAFMILQKHSRLKMSKPKSIKALLIKAEAYLQMDRLNDAEKVLTKACNEILEFNRKPRSVDILDHAMPTILSSTKLLKNLSKKAIALLVEYSLESIYRKKLTATELKRIECLLLVHFDLAHDAASERQGFYLQLVKYLKWLTDVEENTDRRVRINEACDLYSIFGVGLNLQQIEHDKHNSICIFCFAPDAIDLAKVKNSIYQEYSNDARKFFDKSRDELRNRMRANDEEAFLSRLMGIQKEYRDDLRIGYLDLCYQMRKAKGSPTIGRCGECQRLGVGYSYLLDHPLSCVGGSHYEAKQENFLTTTHYERVMKEWRRHFVEQLRSRTTHEPRTESLHLLGLQRWNSSSPAEGQSLGGGYLLYHTNKYGSIDLGVAIDPGFDFVRNLFHMGFSLHDIDVILLSHAHVDHCRDLESIVTLLGEVRTKEGYKKRLHVVCSRGVYKRVSHLIEDPFLRQFLEPYIIDIDRDIDRDYFENLGDNELSFDFEPIPCVFRNKHSNNASKSHDDLINQCKRCLKLSCYQSVIKSRSLQRSSDALNGPRLNVYPTRAYHNDHSSQSDSFGFKIEVITNERRSTIGYTSDTRFVYNGIIDEQGRALKQVGTQYEKCDVILVHLGSLIDLDKQFSDYRPTLWWDILNASVGVRSNECEKLVQKKNHPYLPGLLKLLAELKKQGTSSDSNQKQLILLSEFGEELRGGIRADLIRRLRVGYPHFRFLPMDVGMDVVLWKKSDGTSRDEEWGKPRVKCVVCNNYVEISDSEFENYGEDEGLFCVCKHCKDGTPLDVRQRRLRQLYEVGQELQPAY